MSSEEYARNLTAVFLEMAELIDIHFVNESTSADESSDDDSEEESIFTLLFQTTSGKKLAANVIQIQSFVIKGIFLMFPFGDFMKALKEFYQDAEYRKMIIDAGIDDKFLDSIVESMDGENEGLEVDVLFDKDDERIFLASLISLLHTCVERYTLDLAEEVLDNDSVVEGIAGSIKNLSFSLNDVRLILNDSDDGFRKLILQHLANEVSNPNTRLDIILEGLGLKNHVDNSMKATNLAAYPRLFKKFVRLRNKVIHSEPLPEIEQYEKWFTKENLRKIREQFETGLKSAEIPISSMKTLFDVFLQWFGEYEKALAIALQAPMMAVVYPALVDNAVRLMMESK